jgi:hypothetical protein
MRRTGILAALLLAGCQSPEAAFLTKTPAPRLALALVDQSSGPSRLGSEGLGAYRAALEQRFGSHLVEGAAASGTLEIVISGMHFSSPPVTDLDRANQAALDQHPVSLGLLAAGSGDKVQAKLSALGYPLRLPEASWAIRPHGAIRAGAPVPLPDARIILAHPKLMHGERDAASRLRAEAQAFAQALYQDLQNSRGWPSAAH